MKGRLWSILIGILFWMTLSHLVLAGSEETDSVPIMDETVVTATRTETPVKELGVSTTVVTEKEIKERQAVDVLDVLRDVPGFNMVRTGGRGATTSLYIRGGEDNFTKVLIDGGSKEPKSNAPPPRLTLTPSIKTLVKLSSPPLI